MSRTAKQLESAMTRLRRSLHDPDWLTGLGIGLVDDEPGIVVSVRPDAIEVARKAVADVALEVPVRVRGVGPIRKRPAVS
jgi:hypothetical protein